MPRSFHADGGISLWHHITPPAPREPETLFKTEGKPKQASLYVQSASSATTQPRLKIAGL